jgi:hypothetical protein
MERIKYVPAEERYTPVDAGSVDASPLVVYIQAQEVEGIDKVNSQALGWKEYMCVYVEAIGVGNQADLVILRFPGGVADESSEPEIVALFCWRKDSRSSCFGCIYFLGVVNWSKGVEDKACISAV